ncbi:MAG: hypothetical protein ACI4F0_04375 [Agathobacter sp.]
MRKKLIKPIVLFVVFIGALITFNILTNQTNEDLTMAMEEASLPVIYLMQGDYLGNEMHGYVKQMNPVKVRDSIMPIDNERTLTVRVDTYGADLEEVTYEIRSLNGERLIADGELEIYNTSGTRRYADITVQNLLSEEEEYLLCFLVRADGREVYYYTRLMQTTQLHTEECREFALKFHDYTFSSNAAEFIPTYMDPATGDATTLNYVDLSCTLKQITWANFDCKKLSEPVVSFKEINDSYNVLTLDYVVTYTNPAGEMEFYNVEEYYRLRYTETRMYVLNFERRMNQIFRSENSFVYDSTNIQLGIRDADVMFSANESNNVIAFVQEGELWCYNVDANELSKIYSFRSVEGIDARENWGEHDISIVRVDEAGSVDFIVYGYMNRGVHEGEVGIGVYHYDGLVHTIEEELFIPMNMSYQVLKAELGQLMYENEQGILYLMLDGKLYQIGLASMNVECVVDNLRDGYFTTSKSNRYLAWIDTKDKYCAEKIYVMDLKEGTTNEVREGSNSFILPLGFIDEDFVYGIADKADVLADAVGNYTFPMKALKILDVSEQKFSTLKSYQPISGYISDIEFEDNSILVNLMSGSEGNYTSTGTDTILNRDAKETGTIGVKSMVTEVKETQYQLEIGVAINENSTKRITSKYVLAEEQSLELSIDETKERYYVYAKGEVFLATDSISDAIIMANEKMGVVIDSKQQYMWKRARKTAQKPFTNLVVNDADAGAGSVVECISAMLMREGQGLSVWELVENGQSPKVVLESSMKEATVLDLTGCNVEEVLYYISNENPVFAMTGKDSAVLIVGYTSSQIFYFDPATQVTSSLSYDRAQEWFENAGSVYLAYLD